MSPIFDDIKIKYTRKQFMDREVTKKQYYGQFYGEFFEGFIKSCMKEELDNLNTDDVSAIELSVWDSNVHWLLTTRREELQELFSKVGVDSIAHVDVLCTIKEAARIYLKKTKYFTQKEVCDLLDGVNSEFEMLKTLYLFYFNAPVEVEEDEMKNFAFELYIGEIEQIKKRLSEDKVETAKIQALTLLQYTKKLINRE